MTNYTSTWKVQKSVCERIYYYYSCFSGKAQYFIFMYNWYLVTLYYTYYIYIVNAIYIVVVDRSLTHCSHATQLDNQTRWLNHPTRDSRDQSNSQPIDQTLTSYPNHDVISSSRSSPVNKASLWALRTLSVYVGKYV